MNQCFARWAPLTILSCLLSACAPPESSAGGLEARVGTASQALGLPPKYTLFESGQVRPLALSPDGERLFAVNTPDGRLEIFDVGDDGLEHRRSVPVGLEPVAVAARSNDEVWVVNHLSDSVSVVRIENGKARVVRTLLVGDEPRDIVFAGPGRNRAFITTAHRGQNAPFDPQLTTPGIGRADVWVFDADHLGSSLGGTPLTIVNVFSDTPRALAASPDGARVYVAAFNSGNQTTTVHRDMVPTGARPAPTTNYAGDPERDVGLIVKYDGQHWSDTAGVAWDGAVNFSLPDKDVFVLDATASPPAVLPGASGYFQHVGTTLFNMAVNPVNGKVYVSNTEARNDQRFEGAGVFSSGETIRGHLVESRITVLAPGSVAPRHLNKHIDYAQCCTPAPNDEIQRSLAFPLEMAVTADGATLYVAALGSNKVGVFSTAALEQDTFVPSATDQITVSGGGPTGLVLDEQRQRAYVLTRFDNGISVIGTQNRSEVAHVTMFNPEPPSVRSGRRFLYDASLTSSHGDSACASCHAFGDMDHLAWDLGNPDGDVLPVPDPIFAVAIGTDDELSPMKGPMMTQSLRGMANHGAMHWRGDRSGGFDAPTAQPDQGSFDERAAFRQFNPAFRSLLGRAEELTPAEMEAFTDFALQLTYPPNPIRALDNSLTLDQQIGRDVFFNTPRTVTAIAPLICQGCHEIDPEKNAEFGVDAPGVFGSSGFNVVGDAGQAFKIPHLRNAYQKVGMFGMIRNDTANPFDSDAFTGDQIRGFGFTHDGGIDTVARFIGQIGFIEDPVFSPEGFARTAAGTLERRRVEAFILAFDSNLAPIVGQQVTLTSTNAAVAGPRIDLLLARAAAGECEVIVHGQIQHKAKGWLYAGGVFTPDKASEAALSDAALRQLAGAPGQELTYTCVPRGSGRRMGIDRDLDGVLDRDD